MHRPHILFLNGSEGLGADVAVHVSIARSLDRRRVRVSAATNVREGLQGVSALHAFKAIADLELLPLDLGQPLGARGGLARARALLFNGRAAVSLAWLAMWCRRNRVDVVHVTERPRQTLFGLIVARLAGCACLVQAHTGIYPGEDTRFARWRLHHAEAVVGISRFTAASYASVVGVPDSRVFVVHNAVDASLFTPEAAAAGRAGMRQRLGLPLDVPVIACVARMTRWKAQHTVIDAFAHIRRRFPTARLVLPGISGDSAPDGQGDYREYLVRRAASLGVAEAVSMPGFLSQDEMPAFYGAIDVLAHASIEEPFGLVLVEAMASEKPVVAINGGGVPEIIVNGRDGLLVPAEQPEAMAEQVIRLLGSPYLARELGRAGRRRVAESFSPEKQADSMLEVYEHVLAPRAARAGRMRSARTLRVPRAHRRPGRP